MAVRLQPSLGWEKAGAVLVGGALINPVLRAGRGACSRQSPLADSEKEPLPSSTLWII